MSDSDNFINVAGISTLILCIYVWFERQSLFVPFRQDYWFLRRLLGTLLDWLLFWRILTQIDVQDCFDCLLQDLFVTAPLWQQPQLLLADDVISQ